ncbi:hypothetical protein AX15_007384 [Amanita polypyramis BW_CC]|nr:hypothetical protein AX15_007384 [Amanita polypyramis BW_CC]
MFSRRRSMNPPRRSMASAIDTSSIPEDVPPLPPGLHHPSNSTTSQSMSHGTNQPKPDPYTHHLQQSQSKVRRQSGGKKYPPPIENKAQSPKRPRTASGILDRVSSLFNSPTSGKGNAASKGMNSVIESDSEEGDHKNTMPTSTGKKNKSSPKKGSTPTKQKRIPPPIIPSTPSSDFSTSARSTTAFRPFRSLTRSRSKLTQHFFGTFSANGAVEHIVEHGSRAPRSPRSPRTPWYNGEFDEEDIRRPSGLGHRISTSSAPGSPYGGTYPWEVDYGLKRDTPTEMETGKEEVQPKEGRGMLRETFRFPNRSISNLAMNSESGDHPPPSPSGTRSGGRARAVSSPTLLLSIGAKVKEKLERERELEKLKSQFFNVHQLNKASKGEQQGQKEQQEAEEAAEPEDVGKAKDVEVPEGGDEVEEVNAKEGETGGFQESVDNIPEQVGEVRRLPTSQAAQTTKRRENESDAEPDRERKISFSIVNMFPEPPSTTPSSELGIRHTSSVAPLTSLSFAHLPAASLTPKRASSSTMASMMTTGTTATMTSVGANTNITSGSLSSPYITPATAFPHTPPANSPIIVHTIPKGHVHLSSSCYTPLSVVPPSPLSFNELVNTATLAMPISTTTVSMIHSFPSPVLPTIPIHLPREVLSLALSFLPRKKDIAPLVLVNKEYAEVVRGLLYDAIDLDLVINDGPSRVRKLLALLVKRDDLTALVSKFVLYEWPQWFPPTPYALQQNSAERSTLSEVEEDMDLQNTFLSATLVLALSRMTGLKELIVPSYHPFLFSAIRETTWAGLKSVEFCNVTLEDNEACEMFAWLDGMSGLEGLLFPRLVEKTDITTKTTKASSESIKVSHHMPKSSKQLSEIELQEERARDESERVHPLAKYTRSRVFLPSLKVLRATPTLTSLFSNSVSTEREQSLSDGKSSRPLKDVTINIDMTLYTGLRPTALMRGLHGLQRFGLRFGERVDRRTVEKVLIAAGGAVGNSLEELHVDFVGGWAAGTDETLYKIIDAALPRYPDLRRLMLRYLRDIAVADSLPSPSLTLTEKLRVEQWTRYCPRLKRVGLLSDSLW